MDWQCQYMSQWNVLGLNMILLSFLCVIYNWKVEVFNFQLIQHLVCHILFNMLNKSYLVWCMWDVFWFFFVAKYLKDDIWSKKFLQKSHLLLQSLQTGSSSISFNGFILSESARTIKSWRLGILFYAQIIEYLGNISTKLGFPVMIGRFLLIIELMLGPSGLYCVVNNASLILLLALFCWTVDLGWLLIFFKSFNNLVWLMITRSHVSWIFFLLF